MVSIPPSTTARFTERQGQYLAFIHAYTKVNGRPPAQADLQRFFAVTAPSVHQMILALERRGLLRRTHRRARSLEVLVDPEHLPVHAWSILSLLVRRLRKAWPGVRIVFRGDSGFCRHRMLDRCERNGVRYIVGLARNAVLEREVQVACEIARDGFEKTGAKSRLFHDFQYAARSRRRTRRVIARIEHGPKGRNPRFVVTNLEGEANELYERVYCARGDMENRIKEQQLALFADRTSSSKWWTSQYRVLLAALAYTLLETMRRTALRGTHLARAQCQTLRLRLLKIGAVVTRNTRTVAIRLSSSCPDQAVFRLLVHRPAAG